MLVFIEDSLSRRLLASAYPVVHLRLVALVVVDLFALPLRRETITSFPCVIVTLLPVARCCHFGKLMGNGKCISIAVRVVESVHQDFADNPPAPVASPVTTQDNSTRPRRFRRSA